VILVNLIQLANFGKLEKLAIIARFDIKKKKQNSNCIPIVAYNTFPKLDQKMPQ
jgi:hypothetical protein